MNAIAPVPENAANILMMFAPPTQNTTESPVFLNLIDVVFGSLSTTAPNVTQAPAKSLSDQPADVLMRSMLSAGAAAFVKGQDKAVQEALEPSAPSVVDHHAAPAVAPASQAVMADQNELATPAVSEREDVATDAVPQSLVGVPPSSLDAIVANPAKNIPATVCPISGDALIVKDDVLADQNPIRPAVVARNPQQVVRTDSDPGIRGAAPVRAATPVKKKSNELADGPDRPSQNTPGLVVSLVLQRSEITSAAAPKTEDINASASLADNAQIDFGGNRKPASPIVTTALSAGVVADEAFSVKLTLISEPTNSPTQVPTAVTGAPAASAQPAAEATVPETAPESMPAALAVPQVADLSAARNISAPASKKLAQADSESERVLARPVLSDPPDRHKLDRSDEDRDPGRDDPPPAKEPQGTPQQMPEFAKPSPGPSPHAWTAMNSTAVKTAAPFQAVADTLRASESSAMPGATAETATRGSGDAQTIALRIAPPDTPAVDLRITEREGEIHVSVRTNDADMQTSLRQDLGTLSNSLEKAGYRSETFVPHAGGEQSARPAQTDFRNEHESQSGSSNRDGSGDAPSRRDSRQPQHQQHQPQRSWIQELEDTK